MNLNPEQLPIYKFLFPVQTSQTTAGRYKNNYQDVPPFSDPNYRNQGLRMLSHHDRQNPNWNPFQILERHCLMEGYDFFEARDMIEERIGRKLNWECVLLRS